jgi:hypothetical protein
MTGDWDKDIESLLEDWPYESGEAHARLITGRDGKERVQVRLELGMLQMHADGRPDGQRPYGEETLLRHVSQNLEQVVELMGNDATFKLSRKTCQELRREAVLFYHRYMSCFALKEYDRVKRDTAHNLAILDMLKRYGEDKIDRESMEEFRPFVIMMHTKADAHLLLERGYVAEAEQLVQHSIHKLLGMARRHGARVASEIASLRDFAREFPAAENPIRAERLERRLREAVAREDFEQAAVLRDKIREIKEKPHT